MTFKVTNRKFSGFDALYVIDDPMANQPFRGEMEVDLGQARALLRGEIIPKQPIIIRHAMGGIPKDIIWTTYAGLIIIKYTVVELLSKKEFIGWKTFPVKVYDKKGQLIPGYAGLAICGRCGPIDNFQSEVISHKSSSSPVLKGMYFDPLLWDDSDFFMTSSNTAWIFVRDIVKSTFEQAKITNIAFRKLSEVEWRKVPLQRGT